MIRLLHLADLHPNNAQTFAGKLLVDPETGINQALQDLQLSLDRVLSVATDPAGPCQMALIAGDVFDTPRPHANEVRVIKQFLSQLGQAMPVHVIAGNHDISQMPRDASSLESIKQIPGVRVYEQPRSFLWAFPDMNLNLRASFVPYPTTRRLLENPRLLEKPPEEVMAIANQLLHAIVHGFKAQEGHEIHILVAHGTTTNAVVGEQPRRVDHDIMLPLALMDEFDYVALGHIHKQQQVAERAWYPGSLMRQNFNEASERKGFHIVEVQQGRANVEFIPNRLAREYLTLSLAQLTDGLEAIPPTTVVKLKDELSMEQFEQSKAAVEKFRERLPLFQVDLKIQDVARVRDESISKLLTESETIAKGLEQFQLDDATRDRILKAHDEIIKEA